MRLRGKSLTSFCIAFPVQFNVHTYSHGDTSLTNAVLRGSREENEIYGLRQQVVGCRYAQSLPHRSRGCDPRRTTAKINQGCSGCQAEAKFKADPFGDLKRTRNPCSGRINPNQARFENHRIRRRGRFYYPMQPKEQDGMEMGQR